MSNLAKINGFTLGLDGVYKLGSQDRAFNYSDGAESEKKLFQILSTVSDLSSDSEQLVEQIDDWPTEYHLSSARTNLLKPLNFSGVKRVLELGCGCGSISRFLGEQEGFEVDAVEGSTIRAGLAALRCRDLPNVSISTANFNDIVFPENHYDLVLFIGVTEYAGRFSDRNTDEQALADLLALGKKAAKLEGAVVVAIENRLGLKYMLGANEDHYATPYVGLDSYPNSTGIRTYSKTEWLEHTQQFSETRFLFPFPDYKIPNVVINERALKTHEEDIVKALKTSVSRDYSASFSLGEHENQAWSGLLQSGSLGDHANSFLLVLGNNSEAIEKLCDFDVCCYPQIDHDYLSTQAQKAELSNAQHAQNRHNVEEHLNAQITQLLSHSANLEAKVDLMSNSIGWRFLDGLRRLFGKNRI